MINPTVVFVITFTVCSIGGLFLIRVLANYVYDTKKHNYISSKEESKHD